MVHFEDLDVEILIERRRRALDQGRQQVDAETHVAGFHCDRALCGGSDQLVVFRFQSCRPDDVDEPFAGSKLRERNGRGRNGEVENSVGLTEQRFGVGCHRDAVGTEAGEFTAITPDHRRALGFKRASKNGPVDFGNGLNERAPHAPAGTSHDQPHVGHRSISGTQIS